VIVLALSAGCSGGTVQAGRERAQQRASRPASPAPSVTDSTRTSERKPSLVAENRWVTRRPAWLGQRVLPKRPDGFGVVGPTPHILRDRRLATIDLLGPPTSKGFLVHTGPVPKRVARRSTWRPKCPIPLAQLSYIKMPFWGFDHERHTGEMIVNASVVKDVITVFKELYQAHFPIEKMRVTSLKEQRAAPTGDVNDTSSFECRHVTLGKTWSQHAYGLAVDINPFQNPYIRGDLVAPELARAYRNRSWRRPGMILPGDAVTRAFADIGWGWGGNWTSLKDWMHFSQNGH
jgi:D-alanyl-D-alanine carboxypeptidase